MIELRIPRQGGGRFNIDGTYPGSSTYDVGWARRVSRKVDLLHGT